MKLKKNIFDNIEAVIFDLDGTLVDSMWVWGDIDREDFHSHGLEVPKNLQKLISGMSFTETAWYIKNHYPVFEESVDEMKEKWNRMAKDSYVNKVPLKAHAQDFLKALKAAGIQTGVASSNHIDLVESCLTARGVRQLLDSVHTSCEVAHGKPSPDIYLLVAESLHIDPQKCLVVEDITEGLQAGINAGMKTCIMYDLASEDAWEKNLKLANYHIRDYAELME